MRIFALIFCFSFFVMLSGQAAAQQGDNLPAMPEALEILADRGAQVRHLGKKHGMDGWVAIYQGQEQYYYVTPNGEGFLMGLMFDKNGDMVTLKQVRDLQKQGGDVLDFLTVDKEFSDQDLSSAIQETNEAFEYKTPSERMFADVSNSNWIKFGKDGAPVIYSFMDPQCPHCHEFMKDLRKNYIEKGLVQVRMIPVGFRDETLAQAAFLLAAPDATKRFFDHLDGDTSALPAQNNISTQGIQKNLALMQAWKFTVTPMTIYRGKDGKVKIIRGRASNVNDMLADLPSATQ